MPKFKRTLERMKYIKMTKIFIVYVRTVNSDKFKIDVTMRKKKDTLLARTTKRNIRDPKIAFLDVKFKKIK